MCYLIDVYMVLLSVNELLCVIGYYLLYSEKL